MDKRFFERRCHYSIRKFAIGAASVMIGASIFGFQVAQAAETETASPSEETIHQVQPLDKLPDDIAAAIAKAEQNGPQDSATEEENDTVESAKPATEEKVTEATSPKVEKEAEVVSPKEDKVEKTEKPAAEANGKESTVSEASAEKPVVREEHTDTTNQNKPVTDDKSKEEKASASESPQATKEKEKENQLLEERKQNFNKDWYFKLNAQGDFSKKDVDVHDWSKLNLPHDWSIYFDFDHKSPARNEGGQLNGGTAWYRKTFTVDEAAKDKDVRINFDGVYMDSKVYVNGKFVGHYPSGYNHFSYDITEFLNKDGSENTIAVQVTNKQPSSRWYSGSGIYRDVTLSYRDKVQVAENGNHITTPKLAEQKDGNVETQIQSKIKNTAKTLAKVFVEQQIFTKEGKAVSDLVRSVTKSLAGNETADFKQTILVNKPTLWTTKSYHPQLYVLKTKVYKEGQLVDVTEDIFGYRYFNWTAKEGFSLNGERMKFHGVSIHHDNGALGAEENYKATYRKLKLLKDMGVNSIRTTHNPASPQLLDAAASLGLLVQEEAFDTWYRGKKTYDYGRFFDQDATHPEAKKGEKWSDFDLRTMVERDKNNPSIVMWSLGNEVDEADGGERSLETAKRLKAIIKAIDTERYVTMGENKFSRRSSGLFLELAAIMDAVGMNYGERNYDAVRKEHPDWLIYGSETSSATRTRDSYFDPAHLLWNDNRPNRHYEQSDYGNDRVAWGRTATESWTFDRDRAGYAGQFIWTGFDYIGEPTPWHNQDNTPVKSSYFGIIDTAGLPKNDIYLYRSEWYSAEEKAVTWDIPDDLLASAGEKKVSGQVEGIEAKAEALVKVVALDKWLPKVATVPVGTAAEDLDKTVTAVLSDGNLVDADVVSWTLKDPSALTKEGGRTEATGKLEGNDYEVTATFIASDKETENTVTGLTVGDKTLENFEPGKTYYRVSLPYTAKIPNVGAETTGYQVTVQQASAANDYQASVFLSDQKGDLVQTYLIQFVKEAPALTRLEVSVEGKETATEDQVLPYHVIGHYEDGSQTEFSASDIHLEAKSDDGGHLEVNGQNLLLYKKGSVTLTPRIDNQTDKTQSVATELVIKENTVDKKIVKLHPVSISTDINQQPNLPSQVGADFDKGLPRKVTVTWDKVDAKDLSYYHSFTLKGHVEGTDIEALANVTVEGLQVAEEISLTLPKGETVQLPASVRAYHSNGTTVYKDVLWDKVPENFSQTEGIYEIKGQLVGSHLTTKAHVRVSSQVVAGNNISKQWTGSQLPAAIVSNTGGDDSASTLNDLTVSRANTDVKNRWTTWQTGTDNDWASILFGNSGDLTKRFVDNLYVDFYTDGAIGLPKEYVIEYYVGQEVPDLPNDVNHAQGDTKHPFNNAANWKEVEHLKAPGQLSAGQTNHFTFDKVETYAVRMRMKKADGKAGVGLTEITILGSKVPSATSSEISIQVDGKKLEHFNPSKTDYYIPQASKEITATASNNGLVTVVPATSEKGATRLILKSEDGTVLKEYRIFRDDEKESTQPVAAENSAQTLNVGDQLQLPAEVTVYYPSQAGWVKANLSVQWDAVPEHATAQEGSFEVLGHVLGTDLTTKMQVTVVTKGNQVISENANNNETDSKAFASTTNDTQAASRDKIFYINDGHFNEDGRWTNWSRTPKDQETSVGILFKKNGQITPQSVGKVAIQFFKDSGTDAPAKMVLERYVGPAYTEPSTISRYEENADHPFNKAENWQEIPYKASGEIVAGKPIEFTFDPIQTTAIRARMTRKSTTNGLAMVEFSAYSPAKANDVETPSVTISVAGKALENFDPAVSDYTVNLIGAKPQVTAQASGHGVITVVESSQDNLPTLVRLLAKDGSLVKEYRIHFKPSHRVVPEEGDQSPVLERPSLEVVKTEIPFKEIIRENNDLAQDERRVISEGKKGERVDYVEVLGSNRTTVHTDTTEAQDRVVEVKVKPAITTSKGDEPAPVVEVPEFEGGVNAAEAAKHELPEYTDAIGTAGGEPAPVVEIPEFEGGVNAAEAAKNELPEYTDVIGTVGYEPAPVVEVPEFKGGVNAVEAAKNELPEYTEAIGTVGDDPAPVVEVPEFEGGVNAVEAAKHELPEYTDAIGTAGDDPAPVVEVPEFEGGVNAAEAAKHELPEYTDAVGTVGDDPAPVVEVPEFEGGVNAVEAAKQELPEYTEAIGTVGYEPAPVVEVPEYDGGVNAVEADKYELPEYTDALGTAGNEPAPVVEVPEYDGGVNAVEAAKQELPEYTDAIGTVGDEPAPVVEVPEYDGGVNAVEAAKNELPEYTEAIGTVGDEPAPSVEKPAAEVQILSDKETGVLVAGLSQDLDANLKLQVQKVLRQELAGKHYDAYQVKLLDKDNQEVELKGAVLVRLPVKGQVQGVYHMSLDQGLQVQKVTLVGDMVEFVTKNLGLYAIVYKEQNQEPVESAHGLAVNGDVLENTSGQASSTRLPETGESRSDTVAFLASLSLVLSVALLTVKRKEK